MRQILFNLLGNAVKFTEHGGVVLAVQVLDLASDCARVRFTVRDTGIGIADDIRARLFSPFIQADATISRRFGGTGLGLSIVKRLVALMHGEVALTSTPGEGSQFSVVVPFKVESAAALIAASPLQIAICGDDAPRRAELASLARSLGWRVEGIEASGELDVWLSRRVLQRPALDAIVFTGGGGSAAALARASSRLPAIVMACE